MGTASHTRSPWETRKAILSLTAKKVRLVPNFFSRFFLKPFCLFPLFSNYILLMGLLRVMNLKVSFFLALDTQVTNVIIYT